MADEPPITESLLPRAAAGDVPAWGALLYAHQDRLARMVAFRMDPRLRGRIDADDVVQEAFIQAASHREDRPLQAAGADRRGRLSAWSTWPSSSEPVRRKVALKVIKPGMDTGR
jgi:DNA-directed RNA polymerase specialized sigma24 family protein